MEYYIWQCISPADEKVNYLWCIENDWDFSITYETCITNIKELSEVKIYSPNDIYTSPVLYECNKGDKHSFMHLLDIEVAEDKEEEELHRLVIKCHAHKCRKNDEYEHVIKSVWFNEFPIMLVLEGSRDRYDNPDMYITNKELYYQMLSYLITFSEINVPVINADERSIREVGTYYTFVEEIIKKSNWSKNTIA